MTAQPLIAVTARTTQAGRPWRQPGAGTPQPYLDAIDRAGAMAALAAPRSLDAAAAVQYLSRFDGLLLTGGPDVDPHRYGAEPHPRTDPSNPLTDSFEETLLHAARDLGRPVLCICRGMQLLNVALGGTLHQHLPKTPTANESTPRSDHGQPGVAPGINTVAVAKGSLLSRALGGKTETTTRCYHHQGVDRVGEGLKVTARSGDGLVEGLELTDSSGAWLVAVQWHPEDSAAEDRDQQAIFDAFVATCSAKLRP